MNQQETQLKRLLDCAKVADGDERYRLCLQMKDLPMPIRKIRQAQIRALGKDYVQMARERQK
jgi:hypothetical protein